MSSRAVDLSGMGNGLTSEKHLHINRMLQDYSRGKLTLRRIPERDPAAIMGARFDPPRIFGVWEDNVAADQTNWVFTIPESAIDDRVLARVIANDMQREGAAPRMAKLLAMQQAEQASILKKNAEMMEGREDEMRAIGRLAGQKSTFRHRIGSEDVIIGDTIRPINKRL